MSVVLRLMLHGALLCLLGVTSHLAATPIATEPIATSRLVVLKKPTFSASSSDPHFLPISSTAVSAFGFRQVGEYPARSLYAGPSGSAAAAIVALKEEGYDAVVAPELDTIEFYGFTIDADTGASTPPIPVFDAVSSGERGLYLLALQGYPLRAWLDDLKSRGIRVVEFLPPAAYLVRGPRAVLGSLHSSTTYARGVFPLLPALKEAFFDQAPAPPSPYRRVAISAVEESPQDSIKGYLDSVSDLPVISLPRGDGRTGYEASLTDLDIETLTAFETVYSISPTGQAAPSSERQGLLALQPSFTLGRMTLPAASPNYANLLVSTGVNDFSNTVYGILDTGFDNGEIESTIHPDFKDSLGNPTVISGVTELTQGGFQDDRLHGTITASVITGYAPVTQRHDGAFPSVGHRYALGLAPTSKIRIDKYFGCLNIDPPSGLVGALTRFDTGIPVDVINLSFNDPQCSYTTKSATVDDDSFTRGRLFTVSAGNTTDGVSCIGVRGPATAKNAIAVGASDNFTIDWGPRQFELQECAYCAFSFTEDARNVPAFSSIHNLGKSIVKPDLVAPGTRITGPYPRLEQSQMCSNDPIGAFCKNDITDAPSGIRYGFGAGTSFAAPAVAGAAGVIRRWYRNVRTADPSPAMTKAILINGARDVAGAVYRTLSGTSPVIGHIPSIHQGWGMLNLTRLLGPGEDYYFLDEEEAELTGDAGFSWQKVLYVRDGSKDTRITLVWSEPASGNGKNFPLNDLDLTLDLGGGCPCWYGNQLSPSTGYSLTVPPSSADPDRGENNVEQIIVPAYTFATGAMLRVSVILNYNPGPPTEHQRFAAFADNASETSTPPKTYFYTVTPCRVVDTRNAEGQFGGPVLAADSERTFQIPPACDIPKEARSLSFNVTVVSNTTAGEVRVFPSGRTPSIASTISYGINQVLANNGIVALGPTRAVTVKTAPGSGSVHLILDVNGYFQ